MTTFTAPPVDKRRYGLDAGSLLDGEQDYIHLCARYEDFGITCNGVAVILESSCFYDDHLFDEWGEVDIDRLNADEMGFLLDAVEYLMQVPCNSLCADSIRAAMLAYATGVMNGITCSGSSLSIRFLSHSLN